MNFKKSYAPYFSRFKKIYIHDERDEGATHFINSIVKLLPSEKLFVINSRDIDSNCKDVSDLHIAGKFDKDLLFKTAIEEQYDFGASITIMTYVLSAVGTFLVSYLVSRFLARKIKKIDMVTSLKGNE